jgi:hypothetical protein
MVIRRATTILFLLLAATALQGASPQDVPPSRNQPGGRLPASATITASFNALLLDPQQHMVFLYVFRNNSPQDYEIPGDASTHLFAVLAGRKNTSRELSAQEMHLRYPIVVHPHQVQIVTLHDMVHTYVVNDDLKMNPTTAEYAKYEIVAKAAVRKSWPELNGFRLDDTRIGQSISLPRPF